MDLASLITAIILEAAFAVIYGRFPWYMDGTPSSLREIHLNNMAFNAAVDRLKELI